MHVEPTTGIEPVDLFLTKEALYRLSYVGPSPGDAHPFSGCFDTFGAGDEIRTRDIQLGRLELYQLSYTRLDTACRMTPNHRACAGPRMHEDRCRKSCSNYRSRTAPPKSPTKDRIIRLVVGGGFEPPKASPTDLQSVPFDRSGTPP